MDKIDAGTRPIVSRKELTQQLKGYDFVEIEHALEILSESETAVLELEDVRRVWDRVSVALDHHDCEKLPALQQLEKVLAEAGRFGPKKVEEMSDQNEVNKTKEIQNKPKSLMTGLMTGLLVVSIATGLALTISLLSFIKTKAVEERLEQTPPIVVVDFVKLVESYGDLSADELEQRMVETRNAVSALSDAGYLILDAANIVASPEDLQLTNILSSGN